MKPVFKMVRHLPVPTLGWHRHRWSGRRARPSRPGPQEPGQPQHAGLATRCGTAHTSKVGGMSVGWLSGQVTSTVASLLGLRRSPLERMRRLFLLFAYLNVAVVTVLLTMHSRPGTGLRAMGYAGLAVLAVSWRSGRASGRSTGIVWLSDAAGLLLVAFALPDAGHGNGLVFSTIFLRSLYGAAGRVAVHVASAAGALAVAET